MSITSDKEDFLAEQSLITGGIVWRNYVTGRGYDTGDIRVDTTAMLTADGYWNGDMSESLYASYGLGREGEVLPPTPENKTPTIIVTPGYFEELQGAGLGDEAGTYVTDDKGDGDVLTVTFNTATAHYTLDVPNRAVILTQAGLDLVLVGQAIDEIDLRVTDDGVPPLWSTDSGTPVVVPIGNRTPTIYVTTNNFTKDSGSVVGDVAGTYVTNDAGDGDVLTVTFNTGSTHYTLDTGTEEVQLTQVAVDLINASGVLDAVDLRVTDDGSPALYSTGSSTPLVFEAGEGYNFTGNQYITIPDYELAGDFDISVMLKPEDLANPIDNLGVVNFGDDVGATWFRINKEGTVTISIDSVVKTTGVFYPIVNDVQKFRAVRVGTTISIYHDDAVVATILSHGGTGTINRIGVKASASYYEGLLWDIDLNGTRFYAVDDGWSANPVISESLGIEGGEAPELISNGDFSAGGTDWSLLQSTGKWVFTNGRAEFTDLQSSGDNLIQYDKFTIGVHYDIKFDVETTIGKIVLQDAIGGAIITASTGTAVLNDWTATTTEVNFKRQVPGATGYVDNVSVKETGAGASVDGTAVGFLESGWGEGTIPPPTDPGTPPDIDYSNFYFDTVDEISTFFEVEHNSGSTLPTLNDRVYYGKEFAFQTNSWLNFYVDMHKMTGNQKWINYIEETIDYMFDHTDHEIYLAGYLTDYTQAPKAVMEASPRTGHIGWSIWEDDQYGVGRRVEVLEDGNICKHIMKCVDYFVEFGVTFSQAKIDSWIDGVVDVIQSHNSEFVQDRYSGMGGIWYYTQRFSPYGLYSQSVPWNHAGIFCSAMHSVHKYRTDATMVTQKRAMADIYVDHFDEVGDHYEWPYGYNTSSPLTYRQLQDVNHSTYDIGFVSDMWLEGYVSDTVMNKVLNTVPVFATATSCSHDIDGTGSDDGGDRTGLYDGYFYAAKSLQPAVYELIITNLVDYYDKGFGAGSLWHARIAGAARMALELQIPLT